MKSILTELAPGFVNVLHGITGGTMLVSTYYSQGRPVAVQLGADIWTHDYPDSLMSKTHEKNLGFFDDWGGTYTIKKVSEEELQEIFGNMMGVLVNG